MPVFKQKCITCKKNFAVSEKIKHLENKTITNAEDMLLLLTLKTCIYCWSEKNSFF